MYIATTNQTAASCACCNLIGLGCLNPAKRQRLKEKEKELAKGKGKGKTAKRYKNLTLSSLVQQVSEVLRPLALLPLDTMSSGMELKQMVVISLKLEIMFSSMKKVQKQKQKKTYLPDCLHEVFLHHIVALPTDGKHAWGKHGHAIISFQIIHS